MLSGTAWPLQPGDVNRHARVRVYGSFDGPVRQPKTFAPRAYCSYNKLVIVWDERKRAVNLAKHGLDLVDARLVYESVLKLTFVSARKGEVRKVDLAMVENVLLAFVYVERRSAVRAISLRRASRAERRMYEKTIKTQSH